MPSDIDECERSNGGCSHLCSNTIGTYTCSCFDGYELLGDDRGCTGIIKLVFVLVSWIILQVAIIVKKVGFLWIAVKAAQIIFYNQSF